MKIRTTMRRLMILTGMAAVFMGGAYPPAPAWGEPPDAETAGADEETSVLHELDSFRRDRWRMVMLPYSLPSTLTDLGDDASQGKIYIPPPEKMKCAGCRKELAAYNEARDRLARAVRRARMALAKHIEYLGMREKGIKLDESKYRQNHEYRKARNRADYLSRIILDLWVDLVECRKRCMGEMYSGLVGLLFPPLDEGGGEAGDVDVKVERVTPRSGNNPLDPDDPVAPGDTATGGATGGGAGGGGATGGGATGGGATGGGATGGGATGGGAGGGGAGGGGAGGGGAGGGGAGGGGGTFNFSLLVTPPGVTFQPTAGFLPSPNCGVAAVSISLIGAVLTLNPFYTNGAVPFIISGNTATSSSNNLVILGAPGHTCTITPVDANNFTLQCTNNTTGATCSDPWKRF